jgi:sugar phosphate isomerase/epimerase
VDHCIANGQDFLFETGQETPVTLLRAIQDLGEKGLGINLDPANLLMYGKANPVDSLDVFGKYVMGIHGKDGLYPTNGRELGREVPLGEGRVDFPRFIAKLKEIGYPGDITIEREIDGDEQRRDIIAAKALLEELIRG